MNIQDQKDIFNIFHDGDIVNVEKTKNGFYLTIEIQYLANTISEKFNNFYVELIECQLFSFLNWDDDKPTEDINEISHLELEILSCDKEVNDHLKIYCSLSFGSGGNLNIKTKEINVFNENKEFISLEYLGKICEKYWENWRNSQS